MHFLKIVLRGGGFKVSFEKGIRDDPLDSKMRTFTEEQGDMARGVGRVGHVIG